MTTKCRLCGGTAGTLSPRSSHYLCEARHAHGAPTPNLGDKCEHCLGSGVQPGPHGGVMLALDLGPAAIARSIKAQYPPCEACRGSGIAR